MKASDRSSSPRLWEWTLLILTFLALRLGGLALFHPFYNDMCPLEEYYRGAMAHSLLSDGLLSYFQYRADNFCGGALVIGFFIASFFEIFGSSAFVLRSVPILISLGALLLWFQILSREFSRTRAWYFSLFFIFAPSIFQRYSMVPLGDHYETIFLSALSVRLFLNLQKGGCFQKQKLFLIGLLCGFGVWFAYIFALTVGSLIILWFLVRNREQTLRATQSRIPKYGFILTLSFLIGFSPWIILNLKTNFEGLSVQGVPLLNHLQPITSLHYWTRQIWEGSFLEDIFLTFSHPDIGFKNESFLINRLYLVLLLLPVLVLILLRGLGQSNTHRLAKPIPLISLYFLIYTILHLTAIEVTSFETADRYMMPLMPVLFFAWATIMESLESLSPVMCRVSRILFAFPLLALGGLLWISMISPSYFGFLLKTPGYAYDNVSDTPSCYEELPECLETHKQILKTIPEDGRRGLWISLALKAVRENENQNPAKTLESLGLTDSEFLAIFYFHFGQFLFYTQHLNIKKTIAKLHSFHNLGDPAIKLCTLGIFYALGREDFSGTRFVIGKIPKDRSLEYFRKRGRQCARLWRETNMSVYDIYQMIGDVFPLPQRSMERAAFLQGLGSVFIRRSYQKPLLGIKKFEEVKRWLSPEDQRSLFQGVGRAYEISSLFLRTSCQTWSYRYLHMDQDPEIRGWMEEGRQEIKDLVDRFYKSKKEPLPSFLA